MGAMVAMGVMGAMGAMLDTVMLAEIDRGVIMMVVRGKGT